MQPQYAGGNGGRGSEVPPRSFLSPCHQGGAFSVYRKPQPPKSATIHEPPNIPSSSPDGMISSDPTKVQLEQEVVDLKTENTSLSRMTGQLLDRLTGLQSKRHALGYKIYQLHGNFT
jgi:hypothetical protein